MSVQKKVGAFALAACGLAGISSLAATSSAFALGWNANGMIVYTLVNFDTTPEQDLERIYTLRAMGYWAYIMIYDKEHCTDPFYKDLARWVNNRFIFAVCPTFDDYIKYKSQIKHP